MSENKQLIGKLCCICDPGSNYPRHREYAGLLGCKLYKPKPSNLHWLYKGTIGRITSFTPHLATGKHAVLSVKVKHGSEHEEIVISEYGVRMFNKTHLCDRCPHNKKG